MKLNLGCGSNIIPGWRNHDSDLDFTKPLPFRDNSVEFINIEHALEHTNTAKAFLFMEEALRVLVPGGILRICVPHLDRITDRAHCRDLIVGNGHEAVYNFSTICIMLQIAGFETVTETGRAECDGHWKVIGEAKDDIESLRVEAKKSV